MKKLFLLLLFIPLVCFGQSWNFSVNSDPFEGKTSSVLHKGFGGEFPYQNPLLVIRYRHSTDKLEIYIRDLGYSGCDDNRIYASFNNSAENVESYPVGSSSNNDAVFFREIDFMDFLSNLKKYSTVTMMFSNSCGDSRFRFNLNGSTKSINTILNLTNDYNPKALAEKKQAERELENQKKIVDSKVALMVKELNSFDINPFAVKKIKDIFIRKMNVAFITEDMDSFKSITLKRHPFFDNEKNRLVKIFYKLKNDSLIPVSEKYYSLSKGNFSSEIQKQIDEENKIKNKRVNEIINDIGFKNVSLEKVKKNLETKIYYNTTDWTYDSLYVKSCECELFETLGKVDLYFSRISKNGFRENHLVLGEWYVKGTAPIKNELWKEINYFNSLIPKNIKTNIDKLRRTFKKNNGKVYNIESIYINPKRGNLSRSMYKDGGRELYAELKNGNKIIIAKYVSLKIQ